MQNTRTVFLGAIRGTSVAAGLFTLMIWLDICRLNSLTPLSPDGLSFFVNLLFFVGVGVILAVLALGIPFNLAILRRRAELNQEEIARRFAGVTFAFFYLIMGGITLLNYGVYFDDFPVALTFSGARMVFVVKLLIHLLAGCLVYIIYVKTASLISRRLQKAKRGKVARGVLQILHPLVYAVFIQMVVLSIYGLANGGAPLERIKHLFLGSTPSSDIAAVMVSPEGQAAPSNKVVLLATDGAGWRAIDKLMAEGELPTFRYLKENGCAGNLRTYKPTSSPLIWTTIATGVSPERHGINGYIQFYFPGVRRPLFLPLGRGLNRYFNFVAGRLAILQSRAVLSTARRVKAIWEVVDDYNGSSGVFNWWPSRPVDDISGFMVSAHMIRLMARLQAEGRDPVQFDAENVTPLELGVAISKAQVLVDLSRVHRDTNLVKLQRRPEKITEAFNCLYRTSRIAMAMGLFVFKQYSPHFTAVYINDTDNHYHWDYMEPQYFGNVNMNDPEAKIVRNIYIAVDRIIEEFVQNMDENTTLVILSDHSIRPVLLERPFSMTGSHANAPPGIIIMYGKGVKSGYTIEGASVFDVAPTVLALLGIPVPDDIEGAPITNALTGEFKERFPIRHVASHGGRQVQDLTFPESAVDQEFIEQLKALGYIE